PDSAFEMKYTGLLFVPTSLTNVALTASAEITSPFEGYLPVVCKMVGRVERNVK
ncbi:hypothetical protein A2U01_0076048, partial [Trifolium medium]|nr:hypothetical protein [Trifolium medium]